MGLSTELLVVRHGQTEWNASRRIQGHLDTELSELGCDQVKEVAASLAKEHLDAIYSSDLKRARHSAKPLAALKNITPILRPALREWHMGHFQGLTHEEAREKYPDSFAQLIKFDTSFAVPGGETHQQFDDRYMEELFLIAKAHAGGRVAVFTHGGVVLGLLRAAQDKAFGSDKFPIPNASVTRVRCAFSQSKPVWSLIPNP